MMYESPIRSCESGRYFSISFRVGFVPCLRQAGVKFRVFLLHNHDADRGGGVEVLVSPDAGGGERDPIGLAFLGGL